MDDLFIEISGSKISISFEPPAKPSELVLFPEEKQAIEIIFSILEAGEVDVSKITLERTKEYLKFVEHITFPEFTHAPVFCRLKAFGRKFYIEVTINDTKTLKIDPRFEGFCFSNKRFTRIPIEDISDITKYSDIILNAYKWGIEVQI